MSGPGDEHPVPARREDERGDGGEDMGVGPLGDEYLLQQPDLLALGDTGEYGRAPRDPETDPQGRLRGPVPRHVTDHRVHGAVRGLHHVVEVAAQQPVGAPGLVARGHPEAVVEQQRDRQQGPLQTCVLLSDQPTGPHGRRRPLGMLALEGVTDRTAQHLGVDPALDEIVLGALRHRGQPRLGLVEARQDDDSRVGGRLDELTDRVEAVGIGEVQIQQDADRGAAAEQEPPGLRHRLAPRERGVELAVGEHLLDQQRVPRVVLDEEQCRVDVPDGRVGDRHTLLLGNHAGLHTRRGAQR